MSNAVDEFDADASSGDLSLREALELANAAVGADTILFAPSLNGSPLNFTRGELLIEDSVTIDGNGRSQTVVDAQFASRILTIGGVGTVTSLQDLTLRNGRVQSRGGEGAAISSRLQSNPTLTLTDCLLTGNSTFGELGSGGAISAVGAVTLIRCEFTNNATHGNESGGGAVKHFLGTLTIIDSTFSGNTTDGTESGGGAVSAGDPTTITRSTFSGNSTAAATSVGGAIAFSGGPLLLSNSTLSGNQVNAAGGRGGGLFNSFGDVTIVHSTITANSATYSGGVANAGNFGESLTISNSIIAGNTATTNADFNAPSSPTTSLLVRASLIGSNAGTALVATIGTTPDGNGNFIGTIAVPILPQLGGLDFHGGLTQSHALLPTSLALNSGNNLLAAGLTSDQRGSPFLRIRCERRHGGLRVAGAVAIRQHSRLYGNRRH